MARHLIYLIILFKAFFQIGEISNTWYVNFKHSLKENCRTPQRAKKVFKKIEKSDSFESTRDMYDSAKNEQSAVEGMPEVEFLDRITGCWSRVKDARNGSRGTRVANFKRCFPRSESSLVQEHTSCSSWPLLVSKRDALGPGGGRKGNAMARRNETVSEICANHTT